MANRSTRKLMIITVSGMSYLGPHHGGCPLAASQQCVPQKPFSQSLVLTRILDHCPSIFATEAAHARWTWSSRLDRARCRTRLEISL